MLNFEPYFSRPADVLGNTILAGLLTLTATKSRATLGWDILAGFLVIFAVIGALALVLGAGRSGTCPV